MLILNPELESWILESATSVTILPTDYNLPSTAKELHKITSKINVAKNTDFTNFLKAIYQAQAENFITLQNWIEELISNYKSSFLIPNIKRLYRMNIKMES